MHALEFQMNATLAPVVCECDVNEAIAVVTNLSQLIVSVCVWIFYSFIVDAHQ